MEKLCVENLRRADIELAPKKLDEIEHKRVSLSHYVSKIQLYCGDMMELEEIFKRQILDQALLDDLFVELAEKVRKLYDAIQKHNRGIMTKVVKLRVSQAPDQ